MRFLPMGRFNNNWGFGLDDLDDLFKPILPVERKGSLLKTDIHEKDGNYIIEMDVPGFDKKDISVELEDGYLTVGVSKKEDKTERDEKHNYIKRERSYGACKRSFYVGDIDENKFNVKLENGILNISFSKDEIEKSTKKNIEIK